MQTSAIQPTAPGATWKTVEDSRLVVAVCFVGDHLIGAITLSQSTGRFYGMPFSGVLSGELASARAAMNYVESFIPRRAA